MRSKKNFLKLLTTTTLAASLFSDSALAMGPTVQTTTGNVNLYPNLTGITNLVDGTVIKLDQNGRSININDQPGNQATYSFSVDLNGKTPGELKIYNNVIFKGAYGKANNNPESLLNIKFTNNQPITFTIDGQGATGLNNAYTKNTYGIGNIDSAGTSTTINITASSTNNNGNPVDLSGMSFIDSSGNATSIINITGQDIISPKFDGLSGATAAYVGNAFAATANGGGPAAAFAAAGMDSTMITTIKNAKANNQLKLTLISNSDFIKASLLTYNNFLNFIKVFQVGTQNVIGTGVDGLLTNGDGNVPYIDGFIRDLVGNITSLVNPTDSDIDNTAFGLSYAYFFARSGWAGNGYQMLDNPGDYMTVAYIAIQRLLDQIAGLNNLSTVNVASEYNIVDGSVITSSTIYANNTNVKGTGKLTVRDGDNINGNLDGDPNGGINTKVIFNGASNIAGAIGATHPLGIVKIGNGTVAAGNGGINASVMQLSHANAKTTFKGASKFSVDLMGIAPTNSLSSAYNLILSGVYNPLNANSSSLLNLALSGSSLTLDGAGAPGLSDDNGNVYAAGVYSGLGIIDAQNGMDINITGSNLDLSRATVTNTVSHSSSRVNVTGTNVTLPKFASVNGTNIAGVIAKSTTTTIFNDFIQRNNNGTAIDRANAGNNVVPTVVQNAVNTNTYGDTSTSIKYALLKNSPFLGAAMLSGTNGLDQTATYYVATYAADYIRNLIANAIDTNSFDPNVTVGSAIDSARGEWFGFYLNSLNTQDIVGYVNNVVNSAINAANGAIGTTYNSAAELNIANGASSTTSSNVYAATTTITGTGLLNVADTHVINGNVVLAVTNINGKRHSGHLKFLGSGGVKGTVGNSNIPIEVLEMVGTAGNTVTLENIVYASTVKVGSGGASFGGNVGTGNIFSGISLSVTNALLDNPNFVNAGGILNEAQLAGQAAAEAFRNQGDMNQAIALSLANNSPAKFGLGLGYNQAAGSAATAAAAAATPSGVIFTQNGAFIELQANTNFTGDITTTGNNRGIVYIKGNNVTIDGSVGTYQNSVESIKFMDNYALHIISDSAAIYGNLVTNSNGKGIAYIDGNIELHGDIGQNGGPNLAGVNVVAGKEFKFYGNSYSPITLNNNSVFSIKQNNANINSDITADANGHGIVNVDATGVIFKGQLGANLLYKLNFADGATASLKDTVTSLSFSGAGGGVILGNNSSLVAGAGYTFNLTNGAAIDGSADGYGNITFYNATSATSAGIIGANHSLNSLTVGDPNAIPAGGTNLGSSQMPIVFSSNINAGTLRLFGNIDANNVVQNKIYVQLNSHLKVNNIVGNKGTILIVGDDTSSNYTINNVNQILFTANKSLTTTSVPEASYISTNTLSEGVLHIKTSSNTNYIKSEIGVDSAANYANLKQVLLENVTKQNAYEYRPTPKIIGVDEIQFYDGHNDDQLKLNFNYDPTLAAQDSHDYTQLVLGNITSTRQGFGKVFINGSVIVGGFGSTLQGIYYTANNDGPIYVGRDATTTINPPIEINKATNKLVVLGGDLNLLSNITISNGGTYGSIIGTGVDYTTCVNAVKNGNEAALTNRTNYFGTINIGGSVSGNDPAASLLLVDASTKGNVKISGASTVKIQQIIAKTLTLAGGGNYKIQDINSVSEVKVDSNNNSTRLSGALLGSNGHAIPTLTLTSGNIPIAAGSDIYATNLNHNGASLIPEGNLTLHGNYTAIDATMKLADGIFAANGNVTLQNGYNLTIPYTANKEAILDFTGAVIDIGNMTATTLNLDCTNAVPADNAEVAMIKIPDDNKRTVFMSKLTLNSNNNLVNLRADSATGKIYKKTDVAVINNSPNLSNSEQTTATKVIKDNPPAQQILGNASISDMEQAFKKLNTNTQASVAPSIVVQQISAVNTSIGDRLLAVSPVNLPISSPLPTKVPDMNVGGGIQLKTGTVDSIITPGVSSTNTSGGIRNDTNALPTRSQEVQNNDNSNATNTLPIKSQDAGSSNSSPQTKSTSSTTSGGSNATSNSAPEGTSDNKDGVSVNNKRKRIEADSMAEGVAAGDVAEKFGVWASVMGGIATQGERKGNPGFKSNLVGGIVGVDTMVNEDVILGFATGNTLSKVKYTNDRTGDNAVSDSWIFAGYGNYQFSNNWFIRGTITAGLNSMKSKESRLNLTAISKYNMKSYGAEATIGYSCKSLNNIVVTPTMGIRTTYIGDISYVETGADALNKKVTQKASVSNSLLAGLQAAAMTSFNQTAIMPEAHISFQYGIDMKSPKGSFRLTSGGEVVNFVGTKPPKFSTTIGGSVTAYSDNVEYGMGYDLSISDKYSGHQGSVKVKIKF